MDRDGTFLGKCLADLTAGVILMPFTKLLFLRSSCEHKTQNRRTNGTEKSLEKRKQPNKNQCNKQRYMDIDVNGCSCRMVVKCVGYEWGRRGRMFVAFKCGILNIVQCVWKRSADEYYFDNGT